MLRHVSRTAPRLAARSRQASTAQTIMWTHTDEAPALASYALLPLVSRFAKSAGITVSNDVAWLGLGLAMASRLCGFLTVIPHTAVLGSSR
jgi:hypothetical protein